MSVLPVILVAILVATNPKEDCSPRKASGGDNTNGNTNNVYLSRINH